MPARARRSRPRPRRFARHRLGLWTESLESRLVLVAPPINVASGLTIATGLPLPGLATGLGLSTTAQSLPSSAVTVAPASAADAAPALLAVPSATGPSTTLSPLMSDSETANATASEVARPRPGLTDRVQSLIELPEVVPIPHLRVPRAIEVIPGPAIQVPPPQPLNPAQPPAPAAPAPPAGLAPPPDANPAPAPGAVPEPARPPIAFEVWDAALELIAPAGDEDSTSALSARNEGVMTAGALLAAWGGWKYGPRGEGRSRRRAQAITVLEGEDVAAGR